MSRRMIAFLAILLAVLLPLQQITFAKSQSKDIKRVIVKFKSGQLDQESKINKKNVKRQQKLNDKDLHVIEADDIIIENLKKDNNIELVEEDSLVKVSSEKITWNIEKIKAPQLQSQGYSGEAIKVAVFDTGIDVQNNDLRVIGGESFIEDVNDYYDDNGHGTAVAGVLSALKNSSGLIGAAPNIDLYAVKVLDNNGNGFYSDIIEGIQWSIDNHMDILVMSFGGNKYSRILEDVINNANEHNILIIAASGNEGTTGNINYPAKYDKVICVGATDYNNEIAAFSNKGPEIDIVAPGVDIETTYLNGTSVKMDGTSFSVPHVAGVAAQLWSSKRSLTNKQVRNLLYKSATYLGDNTTFGYGLVDAEKGLQLINSDLDSLEDEDSGSPNDNGDTNDDGDVHISATKISGDGQTIISGESATVCIQFSDNHPEAVVTTYNQNNPENILRTDTIDNIIALQNRYYTCPQGIMNTPGTYEIKFHCPDVDPIWDVAFIIYVVAQSTPTPTPKSTPTSTPTPTPTPQPKTVIILHGIAGSSIRVTHSDGHTELTTHDIWLPRPPFLTTVAHDLPLLACDSLGIPFTIQKLFLGRLMAFWICFMAI